MKLSRIIGVAGLRNFLVATGVCGFLATTVQGIEIVPTGYTSSVTPDSSFADNSPANKLIDGAAGTYYWDSRPEWVGYWNQSVVNIDFNFGTGGPASPINQIVVQSMQDDGKYVVLPSIDIYASDTAGVFGGSPLATLNITKSSANDYTIPDLTLNGLNIQSQYIRVALRSNADSTFILASEINFNSTASSVPDGSETITLLGLSLLCFGAYKFKFQKRLSLR